MSIQKLDTAGERKHILRPLAIEGGIIQDVEILARQLLMATHQFGLGKTLQHSATLIAIGNELLNSKAYRREAFTKPRWKKRSLFMQILMG